MSSFARSEISSGGAYESRGVKGNPQLEGPTHQHERLLESLCEADHEEPLQVVLGRFESLPAQIPRRRRGKHPDLAIPLPAKSFALEVALKAELPSHFWIVKRVAAEGCGIPEDELVGRDRSGHWLSENRDVLAAPGGRAL